MTILLAAIGSLLLSLACFTAAGHASDAQKPASASRAKPDFTRTTAPKPLDQLDVKSTDTGERVQQRFRLDLDRSKGLFLYGDRAKTYPADRKPGADYQPSLPRSSPRDSYGIGIGLRKEF